MIPETPGLTGGCTPPAPVAMGLPPCDGIPSGTVVLTGDGAIPVEFLTPGDRVITRDAGMVRLSDIRRGIAVLAAVSVAPGALGHVEGRCPIILPADQRVLVRDWRARALAGCAEALMPLRALVDGEFIRDIGMRRMVLHQLGFAMPHVVYAGGIETVSADRLPTGRQTA